MTHETNRNNEDAPTREAACAPGGNYGLCKTHPTCEMIQGRLKAQDAELTTLRARLAEAEAQRIGMESCLHQAEAEADRLTAEAKAIGAATDGRPESFLQHLRERAKELAPDYPWSKEDAFEYLWAIASSLEGTRLACDDWAKRAKELEAEASRLRADCEAADVLHGAIEGGCVWRQGSCLVHAEHVLADLRAALRPAPGGQP